MTSRDGMKPRILIARALFPETIDHLSQYFEVEDNPQDQLWSPSELVERLQGKQGAMTMGAAVYYDETAKKITTVASTGESSSKVNNIPAGYAAAPAASADENVLVKLLG